MLMAQSFAQPVPNLDKASRGSYAEYTPASCEAMLDIKYDFKQAFHHSFSPARTMAEYGIVRDFSGQSAEDRKLGMRPCASMSRHTTETWSPSFRCSPISEWSAVAFVLRSSPGTPFTST